MRSSAAVLAVVLAGGLILSACLGGAGVPVTDSGPRSSDEPGLVHIVREGDTLYSIAWDAGLDYHAVARWNGIAPPYVIKPGQRLRLRPPGGTATAPAATASTRRLPGAPDRELKPYTGSGGASSPAEPAGAGGGMTQSGWIWPANGPILRRFSRDSANPGIDIGGEAGQTVKSAADGRVVYSGDGLRGYGQLIIVKHNEMFLSAYAHNRKLLVREGDQVRRGQPIAEMGSTGTDRVKLHFEIRKQGTAVDPLQYLPKS